MITAYVLITTDNTNPVVVGQVLTRFEEVENVHQVIGPYHLIARVNAENVIELREKTIKNIERIRGVTKTTTLLTEPSLQQQ
ncbi:MAG: Lrp/AsnC ligand binding domain-containing protein [Candidatus Nanoarchaeia archaeon]